MLHPLCWYPPQVYRSSVITQWRALDLDVLLTPMLGPAMDLNAPGKATGEGCLPTMPLPAPPAPASPAHPFSSMSSALCLARLLGSRRGGALGRIWLLGDS